MKKHMFHVTVHRPRKTTDVVVAATDEIDAARKAFDIMDKVGTHPERYVVWRMMTADEFEENIGFMRPSNFNGCDGDELISMFLINRKEVRL